MKDRSSGIAMLSHPEPSISSLIMAPPKHIQKLTTTPTKENLPASRSGRALLSDRSVSGPRASLPGKGNSNGSPAKPAASAPEYLETDEGVTLLAPCGDLVLEFQHTQAAIETIAFRVRIAALTAHSTYFARLLDRTGPFAEGATVAKALDELRSKHADSASIPTIDLPRARIEEVGQISRVSSIKPLLLDFLGILHGVRSSKEGVVRSAKMPMKNVANLAVVADRFGATGIVGAWVTNNISLNAPNAGDKLGEEQVRQRLCTGILLGLDKWVSTYSLQLLQMGSPQWVYDTTAETAQYMWSYLPRGVEEELQYRREHVLLGIASLQNHIVTTFSSRTRKCALGYDSSPQCDSFQLGEFIKFLSRIGTFNIQASFAPGPDSADVDFEDDIRTLVASLRTCPAYQVDSNHGHCGPKKSLMTGLLYIEHFLTESSAGICWQCWEDPRTEQRWTDAKPPLRFDRKSAGKGAFRFEVGSCARASQHAMARDFFLAKDKGWEDILESVAANPALRLSSQGWVLKHPDLLQNSLQRAGV